MTHLDLSVPKSVPVGLQVGVVEPADQVVVTAELKAALIDVVDQLLGYRHLLFAAHRLTPPTCRHTDHSDGATSDLQVQYGVHYWQSHV
jgi:hypothetical protein